MGDNNNYSSYGFLKRIYSALAVHILSTLTTICGYIVSKVAWREPLPGEDALDPPEEGFFSQLLV